MDRLWLEHFFSSNWKCIPYPSILRQGPYSLHSSPRQWSLGQWCNIRKYLTFLSALETVLPLGKYLTVLPLPSLQKLKFGKNSLYRRLTLFAGWGRIGMCDYCKFVRRIFVHSLLLNLMQRLDSSNCRSVISDFIFNVPHGKMVYPPKIYLPTLIIVTLGPSPSHREWNVLEAQPSTDAGQQRFQTEVLLCSTGANQLCNGVKWFLLFPTITESSKPDGEFSPEQYSIWHFKNKLGSGQD